MLALASLLEALEQRHSRTDCEKDWKQKGSSRLRRMENAWSCRGERLTN